MEIATDLDRAAARGTRGVDHAAVVEQHALPFDGGLSAVLAGVAARHVDLAGHGDDAFAAAVDDDPAFVAAEATRLDHAGHVEHGVGESAARFGAHLDRAAVGLDAAELLQAVLRVGGIGLEEDEAVAFDVDRHRVRGDQPDAPAVRVDRSGVGDDRRGEHHKSAG